MAFTKSNIQEPNLSSDVQTKLNQINLNYVWPEPSDTTYVLRIRMGVAGTLDTVYYKTSSGTCTLNIRLNGTSVTSWSALSASSTIGSAASTGNKTFAAGDTLDVIVSGSSSPADLVINIEATES